MTSGIDNIEKNLENNKNIFKNLPKENYEHGTADSTPKYSQ